MRLAVLVIVAACTKEPQDPKPEPPPTPMPVPVKTIDDRHLLLEHRDNTQPNATYLALELSADPKAAPALTPLGDRPALAMPRWPGHYRTVAAHEQNRWAYGVTGGVMVGFATNVSAGKPMRRVALPADATGLRLVGDALYVGLPDSFGWIDLTAATPAYIELVHRDGRGKEYDRFVRLGDRLAAIDDEVFPIYGDWYAIDAAGKPKRRLGDWALPGVVNGHYDHAALLATGANEWTLYALASYGTLGGNGHVLAAIPIRGDTLVFDKDLVLQNRDGKTPIVIENDPEDPKRPIATLAGTTVTPWTGLALARVSKRVLLAAGKRGLMILPADFSTTAATAELVDLGGEVRDVHDQGTHIAALVGDDLVVLDADGKTVIARHKLPAVFDRLVE